MGHAHHFLSRLDRFNAEHVELALALYNDRELVEELLRAVDLPQRAERIALALDPGGGPFIVLTREGRFVTCLAEGMHPGELPVVSRERLDVAMARHAAALERLNLTRQLLRDPHGKGLLSRVGLAGPHLCREDVEPLVVLAPLLAPYFVAKLVDVHDQLGEAWERLRSLPVRQRISANEVHRYFQSCWATAHLQMLVAESFPTAQKLYGHLRPDLAGDLSTRLEWMGSSVLSIMNAWSVAKIGKPAFSAHKTLFFANNFDVAGGAFGLAALAHRRAGTTAEIRRLFARPVEPGEDDELRSTLSAMALRVMDDGSLARASQLARGRAAYVTQTAGLEPTHPLHRDRPDDVEDEVAFTIAARLDLSFFDQSLVYGADALTHTFECMPWLGMASLPDLFLPRSLARATASQWTERVEESFVSRIRNAGTRKPTHSRRAPRRHEPCLCGSGKKYGKCCGR